MTIRVRAIVQPTPETLAVIKRTKLRDASYFVLPGGGVEPSDASLPDALQRELWEELGLDATVVSSRPVLRLDDSWFGIQIIYLVRLSQAFNGTEMPCGPEFSDPGRGSYEHCICALAELESLDLKPRQVRSLLLDCYRFYGSIEVLHHVEPSCIPDPAVKRHSGPETSTPRI